MFSKNEKKKSNAPIFLTIGALAVVGAASITNKGKKMINSVCNKAKSMVKKEEM